MFVDQPTDQYVVASSIKYIGLVSHMHIWRNSNQGGKRVRLTSNSYINVNGYRIYIAIS